MIKHLLALVLTVLTGASLLVSAQSADGQGWSPPLELGKGWWQSVAVDREGQLHVGWYGAFTVGDDTQLEHDTLTYARRSLDGQWTSANDVIYTGSGGYTVRNALAVTRDGDLYAAYRGYVAHYFARSYATVADNGATWSSPVQISGQGYYIDMIADSRDILHIVYSGSLNLPTTQTSGSRERNPCAFCYDAIYRRSTDAGRSWSTAYPLAITPEGGADRVNIQEGLSGRLYITWDEGVDWYVSAGIPQGGRIVYSDDGGLTWSKPIEIHGKGSLGREPMQMALTELRDGRLMVVWRYSDDTDRQIYYQLSDDVGKSWTEPQPVPGIFARGIYDYSIDSYELITDKVGTVHLFAVGYNNVRTSAVQANPALYRISFSQDLWQTPTRIFYNSDMRPEWPKAAIGLQNDIHLTWFIRGIRENGPPNQSPTAILRVYYSHLPGNLTFAATQAFLPTDTPLPTATVFQNLVPTVTAFPTVAPLSPLPTSPTADNYAAQTLLGGVFASMLFCGVVLLFFRSRRF